MLWPFWEAYGKIGGFMEAEITACHMCGKGIIAARFCSDRCRAACDVGFPRHDPHYDRKAAASKLAGWRIVAGPPGMEIGAAYYTPFLDAVAARPRRVRKRLKVANGPSPQKPNFVQNNVAASMACKGAFADRASASLACSTA
jgi:hypothetical protein